MEPKKHKFTALDMEVAVVNFLGCRRKVIVPNVSWGLVGHECDLFVLTPAGYAWEVEIKVSKADLIKDKEKQHQHTSRKIKYLYFAIPDYLLEHQEHIPERAGIIVVRHLGKGGCFVKRPPNVHSTYKFTDAERMRLYELGLMRVWGLKRKLFKYMRQPRKEKQYAGIKKSRF